MSNIKEFDATFSCPVGGIGIRIQNAKLTSVEFLYEDIVIERFSSIDAKKIAHLIQQYFKNPDTKFTCPTQIEGTAYQQKVWDYLRSIPVGEVRTYGEVANDLNSSARAVGNACRKNPIPIVVPCHRVVAKMGSVDLRVKHRVELLMQKAQIEALALDKLTPEQDSPKKMTKEEVKESEPKPELNPQNPAEYSEEDSQKAQEIINELKDQGG